MDALATWSLRAREQIASVLLGLAVEERRAGAAPLHVCALAGRQLALLERPAVQRRHVDSDYDR